MKKNINFIAIVILFLCLSSKAQTWDEIAKAMPEEYERNQENANYAYSVSIDGNYAVIGANGFIGQRGIAYVLYFNGTNWETQAELMASNSNGADSFGYSVSISGDHIVIGASNKGEVFVYSKSGTEWTNAYETAILTASDTSEDDGFGSSVSISGDHIVVGAPSSDDNGYNSGSAYVYSKSDSIWTNATETAKFMASNASGADYFGSSVSISGDHIVVGAYRSSYNGYSSGSAYVFSKSDSIWTNSFETAILTASDAGDDDYFGTSVSISGDNILIGAKLDNDNGHSSGSAYVFNKPDTGWISTTESTKLIPMDGAPNEYFGSSVSISGDYIVIGAHYDAIDGIKTGSAYVFHNQNPEWSEIIEVAKLTASDGTEGDNFGFSLDISGDNVLIGARFDDDNGINSGSAYVFNKSGMEWESMTESEKISAQPFWGNIGDVFGCSVAIDGNYAVVGSKGYENNIGKVFVLYFNGNDWEFQAELSASNGYTTDSFGISVDISGDNIVVGAPNGSGYGAAYVFSKQGDSWTSSTQTAKLTASDAGIWDGFGFSVAIFGDHIAVGAPNAGEFMTRSGAAYLFRKSGAQWTNSTETILFGYGGSTGDDLGYSVAISSDYVVAGSPNNHVTANSSGGARVYKKNGSVWDDSFELYHIHASDPSINDFLGWSVDISGRYIAAGAPGDDAGAVYVFDALGLFSNSTEIAKLTTSDGEIDDMLGFSVSIFDDVIVSGALKDGDNGINSGSAFIFNKPSSGWTSTTEANQIMPFDGTSGDRFAHGVGISDNNIVIGAKYDDDNGRGSGSAYLFRNCTETASIISPMACETYTSPSGKIWTVSNTYKDTIFNVNLCDSVITINLTISYPETTVDTNVVDTNICYNSTYIYSDGTVHNNIIANEFHISNITKINGCDSIVTEELSILAVQEILIEDTICSGEAYIYFDGTEHYNIIVDEYHVSDNGCDSVVTENIFVSNIPEIPLLQYPDTTLCLNDEETYTVSFDENVSEYIWQIPEGWVSIINENEVQVVCNQTSGSIVVVAENECGFSEKDSIYIDVAQSVPSQSSVISGTNPVCSNMNTSYSVENIPYTTYDWNLPQSWTGTANNSLINVTVGSEGGIITISPINACGIGESRNLNVTVDNALPISAFTYSDNQLEITFNNLSQNANDYYWEFGDGEISSVESPIHEYLYSGEYLARLTVNNACGDSLYEALIDLLSVSVNNINSNTNGISVYPNPTKNNLFIESDSINFYYLELVDVSGKLIKAVDVENIRNYTFDLSNIEKGIYFVKVYTMNGIKIEKLIKTSY